MVKVFDLDGTLLDSNGIWRWVDKEFLKQYGCELTDEYNNYVAHAIFPDAAHFTRIYYNLQIAEDDIMNQWRLLAHNAYANTLPLKPGAKEYLAQCFARGEQLVLYTSGEPSLCQAALKRHHLLSYFSQLFFAQELRLEKKFSASFLSLSEQLGRPPQECVLYDDSPLVCGAAKAAEWHVVGIKDPFFAEQATEMEQTCDRYIQNLADLVEIQ